MDEAVVVIADGEGRIVLWSAGAEAAFGYPAELAVGRSLDLIVPGEYREAHWAGFRRALESGVAAAEGQVTPFPVRLASGRIVMTPGRLVLIRSPCGRTVAAAVAFDGATT